MRNKIIIANWKMFKDRSECINYLSTLNRMLNKNYLLTDNLQVAIAPSYLSLIASKLYLTKNSLFAKNSLKKLIIAAQNCNDNEFGAYTGQVSWSQLKAEGIDWSIVGHYEQRKYCNESSEQVNKKVLALSNNDMHIILCIGDTLQAKENNESINYLASEIETCLKGVIIDKLENIVIAYEPIYAIGTSKPVPANDVLASINVIRDKIASLYSKDVAENMRIIYGGSVNCANYEDYMQHDEIDGLLIGKTSLDVTSFYNIIYGTSLLIANKYPSLGNKYYILKQKEKNVVQKQEEK